MIKKLLIAGASAAALSLAIPAIAQEETAAPQMSFGTWGFDPSLVDQSVDPGDDFFAYANGRWIAQNPIPDEYTRYGAFNLLREKSTSDVKTLIDDLVAMTPAAGTPERRIVDAYTSFYDTDTIDALGLAPAMPYVYQIWGAKTHEELIALFPEAGLPSLISAGVTVDSKDPNSYAVSVGFSGMGLPDRDYYLVDNERNLAIRAAYKDYLTFLLGEAGFPEPAKVANAVYNFETKVARLEWDRTVLRNRDLTYNKVSRDEMLALAPGFPTEMLIDKAGFGGVDYFLVSQMPPTAEERAKLGMSDAEMAAKIGGGLPAMMELIGETPLGVLQAYMTASFLNAHSSVLPTRFDSASFDFYGKMLSGAQEQRPRWKRAVSATEGQLGEQLGALYVDRYFPPEAKAQMDELVANLRLAMRESLEQNEWMTPETKEQAYAKLDSFTPKIGYPDKFETYDGLVIKPGDALGNRVRSIAWSVADNKAKLGKPVDRSEWFMLPQTVNAYYNPVFNEIVFPAAILQAPFFDPNADPAINYGGIGAVIGHEIGHGFDDQGAKYDATGALNNWWAEPDLAQFTKLGDELVAQYDGYCPYDEGETCVNGRFTLGENIGDVGGLSMAYRAYRMSLGGEEAPVLDGFTGDQRFFLGWAQVWRSMQREETGRQRLMTDPHSPEEYRTNGAVRNMDAWHKAFGVTPGDALYLDPKDRIVIW
ncbi:M13 family metallopeptidase [Paraurantiacibacter namhicola]|uniref:Neutral endopeptidase n=1 Tax=Paraurantiacibacter namhicola TaxID=645517 RepID=A0A1C7D6H5_9SPHN|nr:M13-type metalloendopeptidase [Paraurantiacibacter namhicola]ANU06931.1 Neutral endopeptidase [Paraurantiacibacter namhicola]